MKSNSSTNLHKLLTAIFMAIMVVFSLLTLLGVNLGGVTVIAGILGFFIIRSLKRITLSESGLGFKSLSKVMSLPLLSLMLLPTLLNVVVIFLAKGILPEYITHIQLRSSAALVISTLPITIGQLVAFAFFEEIAWRGFFQKTVQSLTKVFPSILITSIIFSIGHLTNASLVIIIYDLFFVLVNSIIYGYLYQKTNNLWISSLAHILANVSAIVILFAL